MRDYISGENVRNDKTAIIFQSLYSTLNCSKLNIEVTNRARLFSSFVLTMRCYKKKEREELAESRGDNTQARAVTSIWFPWHVTASR